MNRGQVLSPVVLLIFAVASTILPAAAQTVRMPTAADQTIQQPRAPTQTSPKKPDARTSPLRTKGSVTSTATDHCVNNLYRDIRNTYNQLLWFCVFVPNPSSQSYSSLRGRLNFLNLGWRNSNCQALPIPEAIKNEVNAIYSSRIAEAASTCMKSCLNVVDGQVSAGNFDSALSQCRSCCDFLPVANKASNTECQAQCSQGIKQEQMAEQMRDQAKDNANSAKEFWKEAQRRLQEMMDRQSKNVGTITHP